VAYFFGHHVCVCSQTRGQILQYFFIEHVEDLVRTQFWVSV